MKSKSLLFFCCLLVFNTTNTFCFPYNYECVISDFNGVVHNDEIIIAYGSGGMLLKTSDKGYTWEQDVILNDSVTILKIINCNDDFFGFTSNSTIIKSNEKGKFWSKFNIVEKEIIDICSDGSLLYILTENAILQLDLSLTVIDEIPLEISKSVYDIEYFKNMLIVGSENGLLQIFNISSKEFRIIDFNELGLCNTCKKITNIQKYMDNLYLELNGMLVFSKDDCQSWEIYSNNITLYTIHDDIVYEIQTNQLRKKLLYGQPELRRVDVLGKTLITKDTMSLMTQMLIPSDLNFIDDKTIVVVGRDKLILFSYDGGVSWELKSNIAKEEAASSHWITKDLAYSLGENGQIFHTTNGGITWLPQEYDHNYSMYFENPDILFGDEDGNVFYYKTYLTDKTALVSNNFGRSFEFKKVDYLRPSYVNKLNMFKHQSGYIYIEPDNFGKWYFTQVYTLDNNFDFIGKVFLDSLLLLDVKQTNNNILIAVAQNMKDFDGSEFRNNEYSIRFSYDNGTNWESKYSFDTKDTLIKDLYVLNDDIYVNGKISFVNDQGYVEVYNYLFLVDIENQKHEVVYSKFPNKVLDLVVFNEQLVCSGWNSVLIADDNSSYNWNEFSFLGRKTDDCYAFDDVLYLNTKILTSENIYKLYPKDNTHVEETEIRTQLWTNKPYPIPTQTSVRAEIFWDLRFDFKDADISVYNYMGERIEGNQNIIVEMLQGWRGFITWNCSHVNSGVYLIVIKHGDATKTIPILVAK